jgi:acyl carrier protein
MTDRKSLIELNKIKEKIINIIERITSISVKDCNLPFIEMGLKSVHVASLNEILNREFTLSLPITIVFDYPSIEELAAYIYNKSEVMGKK